jgi:putative salt-induced outer membrane protein
MSRWIPRFAAAWLTLAASVAQATPLPQPVVDLIAAAADDPDTLRAVVKAAKKANPASAAEIDAQAAAATKRATAEKAKQAANAGFGRGWTGAIELGGSIKTGNTDEHGFTAAIDIEKETPKWNQDLNLTADRKTEVGQLTTDRYFVAYSSQRKLSPRLYAVGVLWGERDTFAGYDDRFSESLGLGWRLVDRPDLKLRVEAGPALRQAQYLPNTYNSTVAARSAGYLTWRLAPRLQFTQSLVGYLDTQNSTLLAASALTTRLAGRTSAKASYEVRLEANPPQGRQKTDTTSRVTLVLGF